MGATISGGRASFIDLIKTKRGRGYMLWRVGTLLKDHTSEGKNFVFVGGDREFYHGQEKGVKSILEH